MHTSGRHRRPLCALSVLLLSALPATAIDGFSFRAPGADRDLVRALEGASLLVQAQQADETDVQSIIADAQADYSRIVGALWSQGYYGAAVSIRINGQEAAQIPPLARIGGISSLQVLVQPGPQYRFGEASVVPLAPDTDLPGDFAVGEIAEASTIRQAADAAVEGWRQEGFAKAEVASQDIVANHPDRTLRARLGVDRGPQLRFGRLRITGNQAVRTDRIRAIAGFPTGEQFDPDTVDEVTGRLTNTGAFRSVVIREAERPNADGTLDFDATIIEQLPRRRGAGIEYTSVDGLSLSAFWLHRNLFEGAQSFRAEFGVSGIGGTTGGIDYRVGTRFERPGTFDARTTAFATAEYEHLDEPDFESDTLEASVGLRRQVRRTLDISVAGGVRSSVVDDAAGRNEYHLLILPITAVSDRREDSRLDPVSGNYLEAELTPFLGYGDSENGARLFFDARYYLSPFGPDDRDLDPRGPPVFAGRLQFGSILGASLDSVPNDYRFYSGGGGTVRGQDYQALNVQVNGVDSGGASLVVASAEVRQPIGDRFQAVAFYDWGYVGENSFPDDTGGSHSGAGLGVRFNTGIGPIRADVAVPVSGGNGGVYFYVGIGQAF